MSTLVEIERPGGWGALGRGVAHAGVHAIPLWIVVAIVVLYATAGITGHDPWKQDEAYVFGGILDLLKSGDWIVVKVGGVPFMEKPPLFHWVGAMTATLAAPWLPLHDGARLGSAVFTFLTVLSVAAAARLLWGEGRGRIAALLTVSAAGLLTNAQMMLTDLPLMAGFAIALAGFAGCHHRRAWGGVVLGVGVGVGFLGKGVLAPGVLGLAAIALPVAFREWRRRDYFSDLATALLAALPFLVIWPAALWMRSPELFHAWFWENNVGRYLGFSVSYLGAATESGYWLETLPWFLFPPWIFAALAIARAHKHGISQPAIQIGATVAACLGAILFSSASARSIYALPMVPALALVGAGVVGHGTLRFDRALRWLGLAFFVSVAVVVWWAWACLVFAHNAPDWPWLGAYFPLEYALELSLAQSLAAAALSVAFISLVVGSRRMAGGGLAVWSGALAVAWALVGLLWLPWIDHAKSYRGMYESLARAIPPHADCVASMEVGESERAVLEYVLGIPTIDPDDGCRLVLRQRRADKVTPPVPGTWRLVWAGSRPGDFRERFELWSRTDFIARRERRRPQVKFRS